MRVGTIDLQRACYLLGLWKGQYVGYTGLWREEVGGGNLVSTVNLRMGSRGYEKVELLQNLKWGSKVIPRLDCITEMGARIFCVNNRWEFELQGLRHEVRKKWSTDFRTMDRNCPPYSRITDQCVRRKLPLDVHRSTDTSKPCQICVHHLSYTPGFFLQCSSLRITTQLITQSGILGVILESFLPHSTVPVLLIPCLPIKVFIIHLLFPSIMTLS